LNFPENDASIRQVFQLSLYRAASDFHGVQYLFGIERAICSPVEEGKDRLPRFAEETTA
jgi:hypothetical protein